MLIKIIIEGVKIKNIRLASPIEYLVIENVTTFHRANLQGHHLDDLFLNHIHACTHISFFHILCQGCHLDYLFLGKPRK